jgi:membrane fusion protein, multidrug efflux system
MTDTLQPAHIRATLPTAGPRLSGAKLKRAALGLALLAGLFAASDYGRYYWTAGRYLVSTDDAYVDAHSPLISPKVEGYISDVSVNDDEFVKAARVIARIDPRDYQTALDQARANVEAAQATIATLTEQIAQQKLAVEHVRQTVASDLAALVYSQQDFRRYMDLEHTGYGTVQRAQEAQADVT